MFLMRDGGELVEMRESPYDSEDQLQKWLASHPNLLAGDQVDPEFPRRWLLVRREAGVPGEEDGGSRWSLDHLFLDQDAIPTLIEVKRRADTRIRREVVGQMLDYAANAMVYWPVQTIRAMFEARCIKESIDPAVCLASFLGESEDASQFWTKADTNLQAGRVRLVFVADEIPRELQRVIEFLNNQMQHAEVLGVEVRRFEGPPGTEFRTIVPRVVGQTAEAERRKRPGVVRNPETVSADDLLKLLENAGGPAQRALGERVLQWADHRRLERGGTAVQIMFRARDAAGEICRVLGLRYEQKDLKPAQGILTLRKDMLQRTQAFGSEDRWKDLLKRLGDATGGHVLRTDGWFPYIRLDQITPEQLEAVLMVMDWAIEEVRSH
ncbi:MAG TPA: hypothetical protein PKE29_08550 [Phycisphaerales bacterium]|nr:hypothetical protein [Phycisphaerales bacterium]